MSIFDWFKTDYVWNDFCEKHKDEEVDCLLPNTNDLWNMTISYQQESGNRDDWQTPKTTLKRGHGDCEDYAIAKMVTLWRCNVDKDLCRLMYLLIYGRPHMVLAVYSDGDDPFILDNYNRAIHRLSERPELKPIYEINHQGVFLKGKVVHSNHSLWNNLVEKLNKDKAMPHTEVLVEDNTETIWDDMDDEG